MNERVKKNQKIYIKKYVFDNENVTQVIHIFGNIRVNWKASFIEVSIHQ